MKLLIAADVEDGQVNLDRVPRANGTDVKVVTLRNFRMAARGLSVSQVWSTDRARENQSLLDEALLAVAPCLAVSVKREL